MTIRKGNFRVASSGLTPHEQDLLSQQLKMLAGRTEAHWSYAGQEKAAELVIVHAGSATRAEARAGSEVFSLDWPLRMLGLLELLTRCEATLPSLQPPQSFLDRLLEPRSAASWSAAGLWLRIEPQTRKLQSDQASAEALNAHLLRHGEALVPAGAYPGPATDLRSHSLDATLWWLSLEEARQPRRFRASDQEFRISAWPEFGEWKSTPALLRLTALFTRQFASLEEARQFANVSAEEVAAFLCACDRCGLGVLTRPVLKRPPPAETPSDGFLARLRKRLGLLGSRS